MSERFDFSPANILRHLTADGVRVYGKALVSPFSTKGDTGKKCQLINYMVEKYGYKLADEKAFPPPPPKLAMPVLETVEHVLTAALA